MGNSTFEPVTGPTGPEGVKAVGVVGVVGNIGPTGSTGSNSAYLSGYEYPFTGSGSKAKLIFSDTTSIIIDAVTGPNAFPIREQDIPTNESSGPLGSYIGLTAGGENIGSSGRIFVSQSYGPGTGTTFELRGLTASGDLQLYVTENTIYIGGTGGATGGYVDQGITGQFLHLDPRWQAQGASGSFFGASADNTGTGDSITVKFRNVIDEVTDEFDSAFCGRVFHTKQSDVLREYILDVSSLVRYVDGNTGVTFGNICVSVSPQTQADRFVILRTKVNDLEATKKLKYPLWGASKINFEDPLSGNVSFLDEGYGNVEERREIVAFNTPYINDSEGYPSGDGVESNIHPMTWNQSEGGDAIPCPTEQAIIYDSGCKSNDEFIGARFRDKAFCTNGSLKIEGYTAASYCLRITQDMFESKNTLDPWFGKIRLVIMPSCDVDSSETNEDTSVEYGFRLGCESGCSCNNTSTECCTGGDCGPGTTSTETITGRIKLDITNTNFFHVKAPFQIAGITWSYEQRPGLSLGSDDGVDYAEMKNITLVIEGGPENIAFPDNVFFAGNPKFTSGIDILNLATIDNGKTWFATTTGYGWDIDVFKSSTLGSCCTNLNCVDFVNDDYCASIGGLFETEVACVNRTDDVCGAGSTGACCSGLAEVGVEYTCDVVEGGDSPGQCACVGDPQSCQNIDIDSPFGTLNCADPTSSPECSYLCFEGPCSSAGQAAACCDGDCGSCTQEIGSCCHQVWPPADSGEYICYTTRNSCERQMCENDYHNNWQLGSCETRGEFIPDENGLPTEQLDPCSPFHSDNTRRCCQSCAVGGGCIPYSGSAEEDDIRCPGGIVEDCADCTNTTLVTQNRPICLNPATALSCNLINGYFVPSAAIVFPQSPCDICDTLDPCLPFEYGTCCNTFSGECYGSGLTEIQCNTKLHSKWIVDVEDCAECCPQQEYRGACCICVNKCIQNITPQQCSRVGGVFMGDQTLCSESNCSIAGPCTGGPPPPPPPPPPPCENPPCDPPDCENPPCDPPGRDDRPGRDSDGFVFAYSGFLFGGGQGGGGGTDTRGEQLHGSCCFFGGQCEDGGFNSGDPVWSGDLADDETPEGVLTARCAKGGGVFNTLPCYLSDCEKTKFAGACCCMTWALECPDDAKLNGTPGCNTCTMGDYKITCSNCDFDGQVPGFTKPWDGSEGPWRPPFGDYNPIFDPTGKKYYDPPPREKFITPNGIPLSYRWTDCCKNKGGCASKPCTIEERIALADVGIYPPSSNANDPCGDVNTYDSDGCMNATSDYDTWCGVANCIESGPNENCPDPCPTVDIIKSVTELCDWCPDDLGRHPVCGGSPGSPCLPDAGTTADVGVTAGSSCSYCGCGLPAVPCVFNGVRPCREYIFSSCRFLFDKSNTLVPFVDGSDVGQFGNNCASNICETKQREIWGPSVSDPLLPSHSWPTRWAGAGFNRNIPLGSQSTGGFRQLNNKVVPNISQRGNVYTMRFIQR
jgi:hypothetical protein